MNRGDIIPLTDLRRTSACGLHGDRFEDNTSEGLMGLGLGYAFRSAMSTYMRTTQWITSTRTSTTRIISTSTLRAIRP